jgi:hypothetical protein
MRESREQIFSTAFDSPIRLTDSELIELKAKVLAVLKKRPVIKKHVLLLMLLLQKQGM